jgi:hypothetical protein
VRERDRLVRDQEGLRTVHAAILGRLYKVAASRENATGSASSEREGCLNSLHPARLGVFACPIYPDLDCGHDLQELA